MEQQTIESEIVRQIVELMEKSGFESVAPLLSLREKDPTEYVENILINLKTLNAKYDKNEAIHQIRRLMEKYNIQLDQLIGGRGMA
jgi:hypothetical protein